MPLSPSSGIHIQFFRSQLVFGKSFSEKRRPFSRTATE